MPNVFSIINSATRSMSTYLLLASLKFLGFLGQSLFDAYCRVPVKLFHSSLQCPGWWDPYTLAVLSIIILLHLCHQIWEGHVSGLFWIHFLGYWAVEWVLQVSIGCWHLFWLSVCWGFLYVKPTEIVRDVASKGFRDGGPNPVLV